MSEANLRFIKDDEGNVKILRVGVVLVALIACIIPIDMVWDLMDVFMAIMGVLNITALFLLFKYVIPVFKDYFKQKKEGVEEPVFVLENVDFEGLDTSGITSWSGKE